MRIGLLACGLAVLTLIPSVALGQERQERRERREREEWRERRAGPEVVAERRAEPVFGERGELAISSDMGLSWQGTSYSAPAGQPALGPESSFSFAPAADYFIVRNVSIGGQLSYLHNDFDAHNTLCAYTTTVTGGVRSTDSCTANTFGIAPRLGANIPLARGLSLWPKVFLQYSTTAFSDSGPAGNALTVGIYAPLVFHVARHFFLGLGPNVQTDLSRNRTNATVTGGPAPNSQADYKETSYGLLFTVGGWTLD